jgi:two-component system cell cycle sensor histidine kinase/response regulator CckA
MRAAAEIPGTPQDSKTGLHPLFEKAPFALAQCQPPGNITALNPALEQMLGGRARVARALRFADLMHPQERAQAEQLLVELFAGQRESFQMDSQTTGTTSRRVRWTTWRVPGTNGTADYALVLAEDALRNHDAEQRLRQSEKLEAMGRLAGSVAHDFNNLLTGVLLYCDLLMASLDPGDRARKYAEEIRNAGMQATGMVRQLLAVARPSTFEHRPFSLNEIAEGMRNLLLRLIGENIELKFQLHPNLGLVRMDPTQSQQILLNLVLNARDAMPGGGQITVQTSNCNVLVLAEPNFPTANLEPANLTPANTANLVSLPCALFVVADNGSGMDAATRAHLFDAFFTTKASQGTGLGMATVRDIVTGNGGLIHVQSAPACGTRVSVLLPRVPEALLNAGLPHSGPPHDLLAEPNSGLFIQEIRQENKR